MIPSVGRIARIWTRTTRTARGLVVLVVLPVLALVARAATLPLPAELRGGAGAESIRFVDRDGRLLREVRADDASRARALSLDEVGDDLVHAVLAAEDRRFFEHPGVDAVAVARAAASDVGHARVVSGASTLTMQLARLVRPHRRTLAGKFEEAALALRIEASLSKREILEQYLNRAPFGAGVRGIDAASRFWFDKAPGELSLAEAATLAAIPRGPAVYTLDRHPERVLRRRDRILDRMVAAGWADPERAERAKAEPLAARAGKGSFGAPHLVQALSDGDAALWPAAAGGPPRAVMAERVETTLSGDLQREIELAAREQLAPLAGRHVTSAAVVVLDNATGDVLAYVGSPDFADPRGGQNDGVRALRQPGSTLKPFVYGLAIERLGWTAATVLPDVQLELPVDAGLYAPMNYDERFHGPVRLREALGSSLNVPAAWTAEQLGADAVLERLHAVGFASLDRGADWYGPGIALGDGEVTLLELANAYATLARGGLLRPVRAVRRIVRRGGDVDVPQAEDERVMPQQVADVLADVLADRRARVAAFGEGSALDLPFDVAAKTGTSKGSRDNWTAGFTREVTVAVWVGNADGSAMRGTSGITGAAPLFHAAMEAAMRGREARPLRLASREDRAPGLVEVEVCPLSGGRPTHACPHAVREWMTAPARDALAPCAMHETVRIDRRNGLRAGPACPAGAVVERTFERYEGPLRAWAAAAARPVAPAAFSPFCPGARGGSDAPALRIAWPGDGARFALDPERPRGQQQIAVRLDVPGGVERVDLLVDGRPVARVGAPFVVRWALATGDHVLVARADGGGASAPVSVNVE
ncbi:MAG TPA: penicillin-binding protein 1C [Polyangiaceae bacterium]